MGGDRSLTLSGILFRSHAVSSMSVCQAPKRGKPCGAGAWLLDPPGYYNSGKFMTVNNNVHSFIKSLSLQTEKPLSLLHIQLLAAAYKHAVLRDAYAIAKALKRVLVLPPVFAWCDWDPASSVLYTCVTKDNEWHVPYQGPSDLYINMEVPQCFLLM